MLNQVNHWMEIAGVAVDGLLLLRVLTLKLHRTYLFITLACIIGLMLDGVALWFGNNSQEWKRVFIYSRFIDAFLCPLIVWDVFEEIPSRVSKLRRAGILRLITGLLLAGIFGFVLTLIEAGSDENNGLDLVTMFGFVLWGAATAASLGFLFTMQRRMRVEKIEPARNTKVWTVYYELSFGADLVFCFLVFAALRLNSLTAGIVDALFAVYGITITTWCILKLRGLPSDVPSASEKAKL